jgi:hypothetical protein
LKEENEEKGYEEARMEREVLSHTSFPTENSLLNLIPVNASQEWTMNTPQA